MTLALFGDWFNTLISVFGLDILYILLFSAIFFILVRLDLNPIFSFLFIFGIMVVLLVYGFGYAQILPFGIVIYSIILVSLLMKLFR
jgi:hypothetical protein